MTLGAGSTSALPGSRLVVFPCLWLPARELPRSCQCFQGGGLVFPRASSLREWGRGAGTLPGPGRVSSAAAASGEPKGACPPSITPWHEGPGPGKASGTKHPYIFSYLTQEHWGLHPSLAQCKEHPGSSLRDLSGFHQGKQLSGWESLTPSF